MILQLEQGTHDEDAVNLLAETPCGVNVMVTSSHHTHSAWLTLERWWLLATGEPGGLASLSIAQHQLSSDTDELVSVMMSSTGHKSSCGWQTSLCSANLLHLPVKSYVALLFATSCKSSFKIFFFIIVTLLLIGRFDLCALVKDF